MPSIRIFHRLRRAECSVECCNRIAVSSVHIRVRIVLVVLVVSANNISRSCGPFKRGVVTAKQPCFSLPTECTLWREEFGAPGYIGAKPSRSPAPSRVACQQILETVTEYWLVRSKLRYSL
eukprot:scaffold84463_cov72-Phaeocystis_antarctica.AAC.7